MALDHEKYVKVRMAQGKGVRTMKELKEVSDIFIETEEEQEEIEKVLKNACRCRNVSIEEVEEAVKNGADTVEKVAEKTGATTGCGRCKDLVYHIIENNK